MLPKRPRRNHTKLLFIIYKELYTSRCFLAEEILNEQGARILRTSFENENQEEVVVHVPIVEFYELHNLSKDNMELWEHMNLKGFFELPAWGPDYMRAYQVLTSLMQDDFFTITGMDGAQMRIHMTRGLVREALNLPSCESIQFFKLKHSDKDNRVYSDSKKPIWDKLNCQNICLALQLHMQHFHITYPHRWSAPKLTIAIEYSLRYMHGEGVKYDYARYLIYEFHRGKKSIENAQNSKAVCPHPMYLGGVHV